MRFWCDSNRINVNVEQRGIELILVSIFQPTVQKECEMDSAMIFGELGHLDCNPAAGDGGRHCENFPLITDVLPSSWDNVAAVTRSKDVRRLQQHFSKKKTSMTFPTSVSEPPTNDKACLRMKSHWIPAQMLVAWYIIIGSSLLVSVADLLCWEPMALFVHLSLQSLSSQLFSLRKGYSEFLGSCPLKIAPLACFTASSHHNKQPLACIRQESPRRTPKQEKLNEVFEWPRIKPEKVSAKIDIEELGLWHAEWEAGRFMYITLQLVDW